MNVVKPSAAIVAYTPDLLELIEQAGRTCYKSEDKIEPGSAAPFIDRLKNLKHESVLEHGSITVRFIVDRGVSHELVRHRLASFSQESTRYCNYSKGKFGSEITVIKPCFWEENSAQYLSWLQGCLSIESTYLHLLENGATAQEARSILPNSLKTEVVMTANPREWRHIFRARCDRSAHPQMREVMIPLQRDFAVFWPVLFEDVTPLQDKPPAKD